MKYFKKVLCATLCAAMLLSFTACGSSSSDTGSASSADASSGSASASASATQSLGMTITATPDTCDPARGSGLNDDLLYVNVYEALTKADFDDGSAQPWLATDWSYDEDSMTYTFNLREDAVFADGTPLTAADVVYTMERMITMNDGYSYLFVGYVDSAEALSDYSVAFHMAQPYGPFVSALEALYILNSTLMQENTLADGNYGENGDYGTNYLLDHSAGSGAYVVSKFEVNSSYTLTQNENWWGEASSTAPTEVVCQLVTDAATSKLLLQNGDVAMLHGNQEISTVNALVSAGYSSSNVTEFGEDYFMMNTQVAPTDDIHIRRAICYATDRATMSEVYNGAEVATGPVPTGMFGYTDTTSFEFDMEAAAAEIAQSAYADNLADYPVTISYIQGNGETGTLCMLLAETLTELGFTITLEETPWVSFCDNETSIETSPTITNCFVSATYPEAGTILESKYASWTLGNYNQNEWLLNDTVDEMLTAAMAEVDGDARAELYAQLQNYIVDELCPTSCALISTLTPIWNSSTVSWPVSEGNSACVLSWNYYFNDFTMLG